MKKSKVKQVQPNGTWEGNYGMMYKFEITFENGDAGEYSSKSEQQTKFIEGQESEYEFTGGKFPKVKPYYAPPSGGQSYYKKDDSVEDLIVRQSSLKAAVDYCKGNNCSPEEVCETADIFVNWVKEDLLPSKEQCREVYVTPNDLPLKTKGKDDLPF